MMDLEVVTPASIDAPSLWWLHEAETKEGDSRVFFRPFGAASFSTRTQGLRPGLHSSAAPRLFRIRSSTGKQCLEKPAEQPANISLLRTPLSRSLTLQTNPRGSAHREVCHAQ